MKINTMRERLLASSMICGVALAAFSATTAYAQDEEVQEVVVTGSRIVRQDYVATSPIATVTGEQAVANADVTLDTYLNTLPQVNPAGSTTSNNPATPATRPAGTTPSAATRSRSTARRAARSRAAP